MAKGKAASAEAKAAQGQAEVDGYVHAAVLRAATENRPLKLQSAKDQTDGLFPPGPPKPVKAAIQQATTGEAPVLRSAGKQGKIEVFELTPAGVAAVGPAVSSAADTLPVAEAIRLAERVLEKVPDTAVELVPLIERLTARQREEAERDAKQRQADAQRRERVLEAMKRYQLLMEQQKRDRIAALHRELAELGGEQPGDARPPRADADDRGELNRLNDEVAKLKGELRAAKAAASDQSGIATEDSQEFVRNVARRLVGVWAEAAGTGNDAARNAIEVAISNVGAIEPIGEEGDTVAFDPQRHESGSPIDPGKAVVIDRPGWVLAEQAGVEYVIQKARVGREG